jgi:hypothetical protein
MCDELGVFYELLKRGITVGDFLERRVQVIQHIRARSLTRDFRLAKGHLKRFSDEVTPVAYFVAAQASDADLVQFPLDTGALDCNVHHCGGRHRKIEITVAQAQERYETGKELNETGWGRGFVGISDCAPKGALRAKMAEPRDAYTTEQAKAAMINAVSICISKKSLNCISDTLIVSAPLNWLLTKHWSERFWSQFAASSVVKAAPFLEIFVVGEIKGEGERCFQLK